MWGERGKLPLVSEFQHSNARCGAYFWQQRHVLLQLFLLNESTHVLVNDGEGFLDLIGRLASHTACLEEFLVVEGVSSWKTHFNIISSVKACCRQLQFWFDLITMLGSLYVSFAPQFAALFFAWQFIKSEWWKWGWMCFSCIIYCVQYWVNEAHLCILPEQLWCQRPWACLRRPFLLFWGNKEDNAQDD